jgi:DNA polymerase III sliding clamp (beta) subunit (PCNA family)
VKESKFEIQVTVAAYGGLELTSGPAKWWVRAEEIPQLEWFPQVPPVPESFQAIDDGAISRVVHAASKDEDRLNLQTLHFRKGYVEATDKARFARAPISGQWEGLLPVEIFQKLVKGDTRAAFALRLAYIQCVDEVRFAPYVGLPFPNCEELIPVEHEGFEAVVSVESLIRAAKQALAVSETGSVNLKFEGTRLIISTWRKDKEPKLFEAVVGISWSSGDGQVLVNGKNLVAALKIIVTPSVRIGYHRPMDPLKVDTAGFTEVLWPMLA